MSKHAPALLPKRNKKSFWYWINPGFLFFATCLILLIAWLSNSAELNKNKDNKHFPAQKTLQAAR